MTMVGIYVYVSGAQMANELEGSDTDAAECFVGFASSFANWTAQNQEDLKDAFEECDMCSEKKAALIAFADFLKECAK